MNSFNLLALCAIISFNLLNLIDAYQNLPSSSEAIENAQPSLGESRMFNEMYPQGLGYPGSLGGGYLGMGSLGGGYPGSLGGGYPGSLGGGSLSIGSLGGGYPGSLGGGYPGSLGGGYLGMGSLGGGISGVGYPGVASVGGGYLSGSLGGGYLGGGSFGGGSLGGGYLGGSAYQGLLGSNQYYPPGYPEYPISSCHHHHCSCGGPSWYGRSGETSGLNSNGANANN